MKTTLLILSLITALLGCNKETQEQSILLGSWQHIESFDGGSLAPKQPVKDGEIIVFNSNYFYSNTSQNCNGSYKIIDNVIAIHVPCVSKDTMRYRYSLYDDKLVISDIPTTCDEGCYNTYKKLNKK